MEEVPADPEKEKKLDIPLLTDDGAEDDPENLPENNSKSFHSKNKQTDK